jgi:murein DD-endopeptidase MepM/ murein hydrolase activator NlpD
MSVHSLIPALVAYQHVMLPVIPFTPGEQKLVAIDFSAANTELTDEMLNDTSLFCEYVDRKLRENGADFGIGGYDEHRTVYKISKVFGDPDSMEEPRRLHLGTDIWGKALTPVFAPVEGTVHSFGFNNQPGDYGGTLILEHRLDNQVFYTLYGHLSLHSISYFYKGDHVMAAEQIGELGTPEENGQWPPHLHFQLIASMEGWEGDYPGVCKNSEKEHYLLNCPDPDYILQLNQYISR